MKKFLMMALVAVMAFAAQAVTLSWQASKVYLPKGSQYGAIVYAGDLKAAKEYMVGKYLSYTNDRITDIKLADGKSAPTTGVRSNYARESWGSVRPGAGDGSLFGMMTVNNNTDLKDVTIIFGDYVNGKSEHNAYYQLTAKEVADLKELKGEANYTVNVGAVNLPEPTVLALLALGVAGLALKRKVA